MNPVRELHFPQFAALQRATQVLEELRAHLDLLLTVRPMAAARFSGYLRGADLSPQQQKCLKAIVIGSVLDAVESCYPNETVLEEIEYQARRLAKLQVDPAVVHEALACFDAGLLDEVSRRFPERLHTAKNIVNHYHLFVTNVINVTLYQLWRADSKLLEDMSAVELSELSEKDLCARIVFLVKFWSGADAVAIHPSPWRSLPSAAGAAAFAVSTNTSLAIAGSPLDKGTEPGEPATEWPADLTVPFRLRITGPDPRILASRWAGRYRSLWSFPIHAGMRHLGVIQLAFVRSYDWLPSEEAVLLRVAERVGLALIRCELVAGLSSREQQVRQLASHLQQVEERERKRISRELHDEAGQSLLCLRLQLEMLENSLPRGQRKLRGELRRSRQQVESIIVEIRRLISALSPTVLEQFGLVAAIRHLLKEFLRVSQARVELTIDLPEGLTISNGTSMVAYRFVQEALHNILSHSHADTVKISVALVDGQLVCQVADNGVGFRVREVQQQDHSFGLRGISERVLLMGGTVMIASEPGEGATVTARMPLTEDPAMPGLVALAAMTRRNAEGSNTAHLPGTAAFVSSANTGEEAITAGLATAHSKADCSPANNGTDRHEKTHPVAAESATLLTTPGVEAETTPKKIPIERNP